MKDILRHEWLQWESICCSSKMEKVPSFVYIEWFENLRQDLKGGGGQVTGIISYLPISCDSPYLKIKNDYLWWPDCKVRNNLPAAHSWSLCVSSCVYVCMYLIYGLFVSSPYEFFSLLRLLLIPISNYHCLCPLRLIIWSLFSYHCLSPIVFYPSWVSLKCKYILWILQFTYVSL